MSYDVIVLGGGPGGYVAAERAGQAGLKTLLIEQRALGGTCLNEGCIPSKVLLNSAKIYHYTTEYGRKFGVVCQGSHVDQPAVVARKEKVIHTLVSGVGAAMKASHVEVVNASGMIRGRGDEGIQVEADGKIYTGKNLIIATGSRAFAPPIPGVKEGLASGFVMTNREALALKELPRRLAVIGGGVIGLELAAYYGVVGCETTVIEMMPKIAGPIDDEISALLQKGYEKDGMKFCLKSKVVRIDADGVVYEQLKFCEYWGYERALASYIMTNEFGVPSIAIDRQYTASASGQLRTRIQAFVESLEIKHIQKAKKAKE